MAFDTTPKHSSYDIVIVGGAIMGSSVAWHLSHDPAFDGRVLVVERDLRYENCSTAHTNSCIRQQFSTELNIRVSQYAAEFINNFRSYMGGDPDVPDLGIHAYGYLYLADTPQFADVLRTNQQTQVKAGAKTELLTADQIAARYPFYALDDIVLGSINTHNEGYWDGSTVFDWWRRKARDGGVEYIENTVTQMHKSPDGTRVTGVRLASGEEISCAQIVNASGPRAAVAAKMLGIDLPVEPRKRFTWIFEAQRPLDQDLPLTIDPSGVHVRENGGGTYLAGGHASVDPAVDFDDFAMDLDLWEEKIWPALAARIPAFEAIRVVSEWAGHYAYNTLDQNAILGPHPKISNFFFLNGFSGHGLQQSPAMGRAVAELLVHGAFQTLDLSMFGFDRVLEGRPIVETAVI